LFPRSTAKLETLVRDTGARLRELWGHLDDPGRITRRSGSAGLLRLPALCSRSLTESGSRAQQIQQHLAVQDAALEILADKLGANLPKQTAAPKP